MAAEHRRDGSGAFDSGREPSDRSDAHRARGRHAHARIPRGNDFHRQQIAEPQNIGPFRDALYEVTEKKLAVVLEAGDADAVAEVR